MSDPLSHRFAAGGLAGVVPIADLFHDDSGPHVIEVGGLAEAVPIASLLFSGADALREAMNLRSALESALTEEGGSRSLDLVRELFDLLELGMASPRPEE